MKVIVAGTRTIRAYGLVADVMAEVQRVHGYAISELVSGGAQGVDALAERWARLGGIPIARFPADWATHGRSAGPLRNERMATYADALVAIWDGRSRGTADMIGRARRHSLPVLVYETGPNVLSGTGRPPS